MLNVDILFSLLEKRNIKQADLSKATGISTGNISDWKKGKSFPSAEKLVLIAEYLGCSTDYLLGRTDNPNLTGGAYINGDNNNNGQQAINGNVTVNSSDDSSDTSDDKQLLDMIKELDIVDRSKIIIQIDEMKNKKTSPMSGAN